MLVGTNNHENSPDEIVDALEAIAFSIASEKPECKIIILVCLFLKINEKSNIHSLRICCSVNWEDKFWKKSGNLEKAVAS